MRLLSVALGATSILVACGDNGGTPTLDARPHADAAHGGDAHAGDAGGEGASAAFRHTITVDGTNDFTAGTEDFPTTSSPSFTAHVTWDDSTVYIGYDGPDLSTATSDASTKWVFAYFDADPGAATGAGVSQLYNTQLATFPTGFGAEYYLRWKCDGTFSSLEHYDGAGWVTESAAPTTGQAGTHVELAMPRALLPGNTAGIVTFMINEKNLGESSFAGLYADNFTDGYAADLALAHYLKADFTSARAPNDVANRAP